MSNPDDHGMMRTLGGLSERYSGNATINWDEVQPPTRNSPRNRILTPLDMEKAKEGSANEASKIFTDLVNHVNAMNCSKCGKRIGNLSWVMRREVTPSFMGWGARTWVEHEKCPTEDKEIDVNDPFFCGD